MNFIIPAFIRFLSLGINWDDPPFIYERGVLDWTKEFDKLPNVSVEILPGNHHFFMPYAEETAKSIKSFWNNL